MKNKIVIVLVVIAAVVAGAILFFRQSVPPPLAKNGNPAPASPGVAPSPPATQTPSSTANFDTNDNLDQALQNLENVR